MTARKENICTLKERLRVCICETCVVISNKILFLCIINELNINKYCATTGMINIQEIKQGIQKRETAGISNSPSTSEAGLRWQTTIYNLCIRGAYLLTCFPSTGNITLTHLACPQLWTEFLVYETCCTCTLPSCNWSLYLVPRENTVKSSIIIIFFIPASMLDTAEFL